MRAAPVEELPRVVLCKHSELADYGVRVMALADHSNERRRDADSTSNNQLMRGVLPNSTQGVISSPKGLGRG
jgi:hypothetical protein